MVDKLIGLMLRLLGKKTYNRQMATNHIVRMMNTYRMTTAASESKTPPTKVQTNRTP